MNKLDLHRLMTAVLAAACSGVGAQTVTRGELLYTTHCIACHTAKMHWRDKRQATDWESLKAQVRRWQATAGLRWSEGDIAEVARHLNDTIYRYPQTRDRVSLAAPRR